MPIRSENGPTRGLIPRIKAGKPAYAWDDPEVKCHRDHPFDSKAAIEAKIHSQPSFYDREALEEKLHDLEVEGSSLSEKEVEWQERLAKAQVTLSAMRGKKRDLSTTKIVGEAAKIGGKNSADKREPCSLRVRQHRERDNHGTDGRAQRQEDTDFAVKDRIMELELLNEQLKKGQAKAEREAKSQEAASCSTKAELERALQRLQAMPKRFTESLQLLRDEVESLEREKLALEKDKQERIFKESDILAATRRRETYLTAELNPLLDEINDVEDDRDQWKRRHRVESTRADSLRSRRDQALVHLRERFGEDAVERAAFVSTAHREVVGLQCRRKNGGYGDGGDDDESSVSVSMIGKALQPAYEPDGVVLSIEAVLEAARECGIDSTSEGQAARVGLEEFCAIAKRLRQKGTA